MFWNRKSIVALTFCSIYCSKIPWTAGKNIYTGSQINRYSKCHFSFHVQIHWVWQTFQINLLDLQNYSSTGQRCLDYAVDRCSKHSIAVSYKPHGWTLEFPWHMVAIEGLTLNIKTIIPRLVIPHSLNPWKTQIIWCCKHLWPYCAYVTCNLQDDRPVKR
jgi:hypothetical protein